MSDELHIGDWVILKSECQHHTPKVYEIHQINNQTKRYHVKLINCKEFTHFPFDDVQKARIVKFS